jgi:hypothetical protein
VHKMGTKCSSVLHLASNLLQAGFLEQICMQCRSTAMKWFTPPDGFVVLEYMSDYATLVNQSIKSIIKRIHIAAFEFCLGLWPGTCKYFPPLGKGAHFNHVRNM